MRSITGKRKAGALCAMAVLITVVLFGGWHEAYAKCKIIRPCPQVFDISLPDHIRQWVTAFATPLTKQLDFQQQMKDRLRTLPGLFGSQAQSIKNIHGGAESEIKAKLASTANPSVVDLTKRLESRNLSTPEKALLKVDATSRQYALQSFVTNAGLEKAAGQVDAALQGFKPGTFDMGHVNQVQKSVAQMALVEANIAALQLEATAQKEMFDAFKTR